MKMFRAAILIAIAVLAASAASFAAGGSLAGFNFGEWQISTGGDVNLNWDSGAFSVPSHLTLTRPGSDINADRADGNEKQKFATLYGRVVLHDSRGGIAGIAGRGSRAPATLTCDQLQMDGNSKIYTAVGRVHFSQGGSQAYSDRAVLNGITHQLQLHGHVHLIQ